MKRNLFYGQCKLFLLLALMAGMMIDVQADSSKVKQQETGKTPNESLLAQSGLVREPKNMTHDWLLSQIDAAQLRWNEAYEKVKTVADIQSRQKKSIEFFWQQLGPLWEKSPLNAKVTGRMERNGYRIEKIVFESLPKFYVTGTFYLPDEKKYPKPWPGILGVCGHSENGKGSNWYQQGCILAAQNGLAVFMIDPIDQGERFQHLDQQKKPTATTVAAHNLVGSGSILLGRNTATFEIWDMIRAIDYLQSRPEIIPEKIGAMGNSGGGTQTAYIMALDPRVQVAAPACYICNLFDTLTHVNGPQDAEQNIFGQLKFGMDHADYAIMRGPRPTLLCTATRDMFNIDDAWKSFRFAKRIYGRLGYPERMDLTETDNTHGWHPQLREASVRWMLRWLAGREEVVTANPDEPVLSDDEIRSVPAPGVLALPAARTTYDLNRDLARTLTPVRKKLWQNMTQQKAADLLRSVAGIRNAKELSPAILHKTPKTNHEFILESEPGIYLPCSANIQNDCKAITIYIGDSGRKDKFAAPLLADTNVNVLSVELRGWGESQYKGAQYYKHSQFGFDGTDYYLAYLLGKSYVGMRTEDLIRVAQWLRKQYPDAKLNLLASGYARTIALHAKIVEPQLFQSLELKDPETVSTWNSLVENAPCPIQLTDTIHGVLNSYDLDDLISFKP